MDPNESDSSLSSTRSTDDEALIAKMTKPAGIDRYFKPAPKVEREPTPEPPKRAPSPPHEFVLADNDAIAFVVMFRSRFADAFPKSLPHYGPQDIERGISSEVPDEDLERLLCALLSLVLNRKKDVEKGHYNRALEDAINSNKHQWPVAWQGQNPLPGEKTFNSLTAEERLILLKTLVLWALNSSESVQAILKDSYKQTRRDDDKNQPRSVQPWFSDSYRRRYYLIEGAEDTHFRVYRENDGKTQKTNVWFSVASTIDQVKELADKFEDEGTANARLNAERMKAAIPRWEAGEEKRRRRDYRLARKAAFARPEPGFSLYEGRTRGKRMKYTFSDGEEESSEYSGLRSMRNSRYATPSEAGPTITASGRHVKQRAGGVYGESMLIDQRKEHEANLGDSAELTDEGSVQNGRTSRVGRPLRGRYADGLQSESETDGAPSSGNEWSGDENESDDEPDEHNFEGDDEEDDIYGIVADDEEGDDDEPRSLVVNLRYRPDAAAKLRMGVSRSSTPGLANGVHGMSLKGPASVNGSESKETAALPQYDASRDTLQATGASHTPTLQQRQHQSEFDGSSDIISTSPAVNGVHITNSGPPLPPNHVTSTATTTDNKPAVAPAFTYAPAPQTSRPSHPQLPDQMDLT